MKTCPFCKKEIQNGAIKCPHCSRTLVETGPHNRAAHNFGHQSSAFSNSAKDDETKGKKLRGYFTKFTAFTKRPFTKKVYRLGRNKWDRYKLAGVTLAIVLFFIAIYLHQQKIPNSPTVNKTVQSISETNRQSAPTQQLVNTPTPQQSPPPVYLPLDNGTVVVKNSYYFKGRGELTIDNGTGNDALAKLVNTVNNKSVFTVYISANNTYIIKNISDGNYKLVFSLGQDWDNANKVFTSDLSYEVFDDPFNFVTTKTLRGDYENTQYTTFSVTLNPVEGGQAKTGTIDPQEFNSY